MSRRAGEEDPPTLKTVRSGFKASVSARAAVSRWFGDRSRGPLERSTCRMCCAQSASIAIVMEIYKPGAMVR